MRGIIISERGKENPKEREEKTMVEIITSKMTRIGRTEHEYEGTARLEDVAQKKTIIDLLDCSNFGGYVEVRTTEEKNVYEFNAVVYID